MAPKRVIAHLDCDAFFASVELLRHPELRGRPMIVAGSGPRAVVTTASYEARAYGIGSAMPAAEARRRCPQAVVLAPDHTHYQETAARVWAIVGARLAVLQRLSLDEAYADLTGIKRPLPTLRAVIADVLAATGLQLSAGIAPNRLVAKIASDLGKPAGFVAIGREDAAARLRDRSVRIIPGIGPKTAARLATLGCRTLGELQQLGAPSLATAFGPRLGPELHQRAFLHDDSPVVVEREIKSRSTETTFDVDVGDLQRLTETTCRMSRRLGDDMRRAGVLARTVGIKVRLDDWTTVTRARTLPAATDDAGEIAATAELLLRDYAPPRPVRLIGVRLASLTTAAREQGRGHDQAQLALPLW